MPSGFAGALPAQRLTRPAATGPTCGGTGLSPSLRFAPAGKDPPSLSHPRTSSRPEPLLGIEPVRMSGPLQSPRPPSPGRLMLGCGCSPDRPIKAACHMKKRRPVSVPAFSHPLWVTSNQRPKQSQRPPSPQVGGGRFCLRRVWKPLEAAGRGRGEATRKRGPAPLSPAPLALRGLSGAH